MPVIPAFCNTCGGIFPSGFAAENSTGISFSNCSSGPCPVCGGMGHIPDGVYNFIGNTIQLLSGPRRTVDELERLANILRSSRENGSTLDEIKEKVQREVPELTSISDVLPRTRQDLYQFISIIISIITLIITLSQSSNEKTVEINEVVNYIYQQTDTGITRLHNEHTLDIKDSPKGGPVRINKVGRNEKCPCGSGKKYKYCHGR